MPSSKREACACGLLCRLQFDRLPDGATSFTADWPNGGHLVVEADGLVSRCGLAPGEPTRFACPPR